MSQLTLDKLENPESIEDMLLTYIHDVELKDAYINLVSISHQKLFAITMKSIEKVKGGNL